MSLTNIKMGRIFCPLQSESERGKYMNQQIFRKKSIDRISSPEQLDAYIRVATPSVWLLLAAIVILLMGVCIWGVVGRLDTTLSSVAIVENGQTTVYVRDADISLLREGMEVTLADTEGMITAIAAEPIVVNQDFAEYACYVGGFQEGQWVYAVSVSGSAADGIYSAKILIESVTPMSFVIN